MSLSVLFAQFDVSEVARSSQAPRDATSYLDLFLSVAAILASLGAVIYCWNRVRAKVKERGDSPQSLFQELCSVHRLTRSEKSLLMRAITSAEMGEPALAFVNPGVLGLMEDSPEAVALAQKLFGRSD